jgi:uncharacterized protein (TIGR02246 family)
MTDDETAIRALIATWMQASEDGDIDSVLDLMADDAVFMTPGREPFGKDAFRAAAEGMKHVTMQGKSEIRELQVLGEWAFIRNHIEMTMTPPGMTRAGYTMTLLRKESDGRWRLARDANLLVPKNA